MKRQQSPQNVSLIVSSAAPLSQQSRLSRALHDFICLLSEEEKIDYEDSRGASPPQGFDVSHFTMDIEKKIKREQRRSINKLWKALDALRPLTSAVDMIVGGSQNEIACSVWAIVRFAMQVKNPFLHARDFRRM